MYVDLQICFVIDHHNSMTNFMGALKDQIEDIVKDVQNQYPTKTIEVAFVGYGGYYCLPGYVLFSFTQNIRNMQKSLKLFKKAEISFTSSCRDIQMAYGRVNDLQWHARKRIIFHMGNGPAFGHKYHDPNVFDLNPSAHAYLVLEEDVEKFALNKIDLVLLKLDKNWDVMIKVIEDHYSNWRNYGLYVEDLTQKHNTLNDAVYSEVKKHILRQFI